MTREEIVERIKFCGQGMIDNADKIAAGYQYATKLVITCYPYDDTSAPEINVDASFIPECFIDFKMK